MATPGWYPDPAGQPGAFRYWDGAAWGADLSDTPYAPPPGSAPPAAPPAPPAPPPGPPVTPSTPAAGLDEPTRYPGTPGSEPPSAPETAIAPGFPVAPAKPAQPAQPAQPAPPPSYQPAYQQPYQQGPPATPPAYQPYEQPGWSAGAPAQPSWAPGPGGPGAPSSGGGGKAIGLVLLAVVLVLALGVGTFFVVRSLTDDEPDLPDLTPAIQPESERTSQPTTEPTDEPTDEPTEVPTEDPGDEPVDPFTDAGVPTTQQCTGGRPASGVTGEQGNRLTGGGLSMKKVPGFSAALDQSAAFEFADGVFAPSKEIERTETSGWVAVYALGALAKDNGFTSPGQAAGVVLECMARSETFYTDFTGAVLLGSEATTVDGADAWVMDAEIRIDSAELSVEGDIAKVIVVDTGDPASYGLFVSVVPIGDQALIDQQQTQAGLLQVQ